MKNRKITSFYTANFEHTNNSDCLKKLYGTALTLKNKNN